MNEQKTYQQLLQDVADLKQIVCELARQNSKLVDRTWFDTAHGDEEGWKAFSWEAYEMSAVIAKRLNPINFCLDCNSPIRYRIIPCWGQSGIGCDCPDKPLLNISTLTAEIPNSDQTVTLSDWNIGFIPPNWRIQNPCDETLVGQWPPDHMG